MTAYQILLHTRNSLNISLPQEESNIVIAQMGASGAVISLQDPLPAAANNGWRYGVVEYLDGPAAGMWSVVMQSDTQMLHLGGLFLPGVMPQPGNKINLKHGPLGAATTKKFLGEPDSFPDSVQLAVVVTLPTISDNRRSFGEANQHAGHSKVSYTLHIETSASMKLFTDREQYLNKIFQLLEQTRGVLLGLRSSSALSVFDGSPVVSNHVMIPRNPPRMGYLSRLTFDLSR